MQWDDLSSYAYTDTHTVKDWGWEFIRRDARYKKEWENAVSNFEETPKGHILMPFLLAPDLSQYSDRYANGTLNLIVPDDINSFVIPADGAIKWGIPYYQNPEATKLAQANHLKVMAVPYNSTSSDEITVTSNDSMLLVAVDLKKPIAPQVKEISKRAKKMQSTLQKHCTKCITPRAEKISANDRKVWVGYLRCIDAKNAGIKTKEASHVIFHGDAVGAETRWNWTFKQINKLAIKKYQRWMS